MDVIAFRKLKFYKFMGDHTMYHYILMDQTQNAFYQGYQFEGDTVGMLDKSNSICIWT